jgi:hypothetical protein
VTTYKIVLKVSTPDWNDAPDWLIYEVRELVKKNKDVMTYASIEIENE